MSNSQKEQAENVVLDQLISSFTLVKAQLSSIDHLCFSEDVSYVKCNGIDILSTGVDFVEDDNDNKIKLVFFGDNGVQAIVETDKDKFAGIRVDHFSPANVEVVLTYVEINIIPR